MRVGRIRRDAKSTSLLEPPGETHTLVVPEGCEEMITVFSVGGALIYIDPEGAAIGYDDVFTRLAIARRHWADVGLEPGMLEQMVRQEALRRFAHR